MFSIVRVLFTFIAVSVGLVILQEFLVPTVTEEIKLTAILAVQASPVSREAWYRPPGVSDTSEWNVQALREGEEFYRQKITDGGLVLTAGCDFSKAPAVDNCGVSGKVGDTYLKKKDNISTEIWVLGPLSIVLLGLYSVFSGVQGAMSGMGPFKGLLVIGLGALLSTIVVGFLDTALGQYGIQAGFRGMEELIPVLEFIYALVAIAGGVGGLRRISMG